MLSGLCWVACCSCYWLSWCGVSESDSRVAVQ
jgi:hypothetical protein